MSVSLSGLNKVNDINVQKHFSICDDIIYLCNIHVLTIFLLEINKCRTDKLTQ